MTPRRLTIACVLALAIAWPFLPEFTATLLCYIGLYAMVATGLVLLTGIGGMTSFGQAAFVGVGAYATAWLTTSPIAASLVRGWLSTAMLPWAGLLLGLVLAAAIAWALGAIT
ncbi:MAG TPA: metal-dependent hydrolase, partial [Ramlibacter sp.]|nr:metal-dependent hydrolase [Ramlibacter sp.]